MTRKKKPVLMMAIAKGNVSTDAVEIKKYIGIGAVNVIAVNPTKAQIKELMGYEPQEEPVYIGVQEIDGKQVNYARVDFIIKTDVEKTGIDYTGRMTYFIRNQYRKGSESGKYQVLDNYNNYAWATQETIEAKGTVMYKNGPAKLIGEYRPAYVGEWELMNFLRQYLVIGSSGETNGFDYINGSWVEKNGDALKDCECCFSTSEIQGLFKGNFSSIKDAIALQPTNKIKVLFGIRAGEDGREFQDIYTAAVIRNNSSNYTSLQKKVEESKANGGLSNRTYEFCDLKEYTVVPTDFTKTPAASDNPFGETPTGPTPW